MNRWQIPQLAGVLVLLSLLPVRAGVGNPQIRTDHPLYPGELAYSTLDRFAHSIINSGDWGLGLGDSHRDIALKLWLWKITHTMHDFTPKLWTAWLDHNRDEYKVHSAEHPTRPDSLSPPSALNEDQDSLRWTFSFGYALCTTLHGNIQPQIEAIGQGLATTWRSRCLGIPYDTNHEIYFDGKWRMFDVNAGTLLWSSDESRTADLLPFAAAFGPEGGPRHVELLDDAPKFNGKYLPKLVWGEPGRNGKPKSYTWMRDVLELPSLYWNADQVDRKSSCLFLMYYCGYNACPITYSLKAGETFTRWFDGDDAWKELGLRGRIWWGANLKGGPGTQTQYTHYLRDLPECCQDTDPLVFAEDTQIDNRYALHNPKTATHGNGLYDWQPDLATDDWKEGLAAIDGPIHADGQGITARGPASVAFAFFSPYIIAAMPADDTDPAKDGATNGAVLTAEVAGQIAVDVSTNNGLSFQPVGTLQGNSWIDFTDAVKGRNQYLLRFHLDKGLRLESLHLRTVVTTCRAIYPKLKSGKTTITYQSDGQTAFEASPDFAHFQLATAEQSFVSQQNLTWASYDGDLSVAWRTDKREAGCIYKITSPTAATLNQVSAAVNLSWPSPTPKGAWAELAVSASPNGPWTVIRKLDPQAEDVVNRNICPWYWIYGATDVSRQALKTAYVRIRFSGAGKPCGIRYVYLYGTYPAGAASPLTMTYYWKSGDEIRRHAETVPAGQAQYSYTIDTGPGVRNLKVVFAVPASK